MSAVRADGPPAVAAHPELATSRPSVPEPMLPEAGEQAGQRSGPTWMPHRLSVLALVVGLVLTGGLASTAHNVGAHNEERLVKVQVRQAAATLAAELAAVQTPLQGVYAVAEASNADESKFESFIAPDVGAGKAFDSVSLWRVTGDQATPVIVVGKTPMLAHSATAASDFISHVQPSPLLSVAKLYRGPQPRLGFAELPPGGVTAWVVYAESLLPATSSEAITRNSAFADLNFEVFFGNSTAKRDLLETSTPLSTPGARATAEVPFGNSRLTLVGIPTQPLDGPLSEGLPMIIWFVGGFLALMAAITAERLIRRREVAETLAVENAHLYGQQRGIAETLQHALLPTDFPHLGGFEVATRYVPGVGGMDIGGDWYDVIEIDGEHCFIVVGDVSGRGLSAATTMAALRYAIRAYAAEGHAPETILVKLGELVNVGRGGHFATVLCGLVDVPARHVKLATAGHPAPLVVSDDGASYLELPIGVPVGVPSPMPRFSADFTLAPGATLVAFTDGLVERRREIIDEGLERLRQASLGETRSVDQLLGHVLATLTPEGSDDDIAILGVRWTR